MTILFLVVDSSVTDGTAHLHRSHCSFNLTAEPLCLLHFTASAVVCLRCSAPVWALRTAGQVWQLDRRAYKHIVAAYGSKSATAEF